MKHFMNLDTENNELSANIVVGDGNAAVRAPGWVSLDQLLPGFSVLHLHQPAMQGDFSISPPQIGSLQVDTGWCLGAFGRCQNQTEVDTVIRGSATLAYSGATRLQARLDYESLSLQHWGTALDI